GVRPGRQDRVDRGREKCRRHALVGRPVQRVLASGSCVDRWRACVRSVESGIVVAHGLRAWKRSRSEWRGAMKSGIGNRESGIGRQALFATVALSLAASVAVGQTVAITGGKVYPVSGPVIENGTVLVRDGKIVAVGANVTVPNDATRIDATGKWVTPGLINALTGLGVSEIGQVQATVDRSARGDSGVAAAFPIWEGINPASTMFAPARNDGITSVVVVPTGGLIAGQAALI